MAATTIAKSKVTLSFEEKWASLHPTVEKLLCQENVSREKWYNLFSSVHQIFIWETKGPTNVEGALKHDICQFITQAQKRVVNHHEDQALLKAYISEWRRYFEQCNYLPLPFYQLESTLSGRIPTAGPKKFEIEKFLVRKIMLDSWNEKIFNDIKLRLQDAAITLINLERNGEVFDSQLIIGVRESYVNLCSDSKDKLKIYKENFEKAYLAATRSFYQVKASQYLEANSVENYMKFADQKLREEEKRGDKYLETSGDSMEELDDCIVDVLVTNFKDTIVAECLDMIRNYETENLNLMFRLLDRVSEGIQPMFEKLEEHIVSAGIADMIEAAESITQNSEQYVEKLLDLFKKFSLLVKDAFNEDPRFLTARDKAYKQVVNDTAVFKLELPWKAKRIVQTEPESKCPELLAHHCDLLLRKTLLSKRLTAEEIENKLKDVLLVLKYVNNKDVFMRHYQAHLARRLILATSVDSEMEEGIVERLKEVGMPADSVNKLARMFQDIKVSEDINQQFKEVIHSDGSSVVDNLNLKILNSGAWTRGSERVSVSLPMELEEFIPEVEDFYTKKHSGRKLQWHHHMSNGTITFANNVGKFDIDVTTFQMAALCAWNQRPYEKISFDNLRLATELPDPELRRTLWSLVAFPKIKRQILLMNKEIDSSNDFTENTLFWVNQDFAPIKNGKLQKKGKLNLIGRLQLTTEKSHEEDNERIIKLRILRTQEAIMKILKMRKTISNAQLQTELVEMLKNMFLPSKKLIIEQLEWLIEHKYMKRDEDNLNIFIYMA